MAELKRTLKINMWKILLVVGFIAWIVLMFFDRTQLAPGGLFTGFWYQVGVHMIIAIFCSTIFIFVAQIRSAKTVCCQGSDTWDPAEWHEIPPETVEGKIITPRLLIRAVGGFKAMGVYVGGKGAKGWDIVIDWGGIWFRRGANLVLNTDTRETYIGEFEHQEVYNIIDKLNTYLLGIPGMISIAHDTPIYVYAVPAEYPGLDEDIVNHIADVRDIEKHFSARLAKHKATILDLQMTIGKLRGANNSTQVFQTALRPKGVENDGTTPPNTQ